MNNSNQLTEVEVQNREWRAEYNNFNRMSRANKKNANQQSGRAEHDKQKDCNIQQSLGRKQI